MEPGSSWVWETHGQREQMLRREKEQQAARLLWQRQDARQERAELLAQHQQRLSALEQQHQLERLRELQRLYQHLAAWTEPGWGLGDLMAHGAPSWPSSPALDPNTQSEEQQVT
ncbi:fas-binding factor 1 homolog isoform X2 [Caloenas nicobarica]